VGTSSYPVLGHERQPLQRKLIEWLLTCRRDLLLSSNNLVWDWKQSGFVADEDGLKLNVYEWN